MSKKKECSNLETRTMNVTMSQDDFKKLDSGELRSMDSAIVLVILRLLLIFLIFQKMNFLNVR